ncbi:MAG: hypothetical protein LIR50_18895 [Bacillota bacterium]|nr:hypothetical protein [Bacillota bacterium]
MIVNFFSDFCYPGGLSIHQGEVALILNEKYNVDIRICIPWPLRYDMKSHKDLIENCEKLE